MRRRGSARRRGAAAPPPRTALLSVAALVLAAALQPCSAQLGSFFSGAMARWWADAAGGGAGASGVAGFDDSAGPRISGVTDAVNPLPKPGQGVTVRAEVAPAADGTAVAAARLA